MEERRYFGCSVRQRQDKDTVSFFVFYARAKDIKEWIGIKRVQDSVEGTQRILRQTRRKAITRFIKSDSINTIPNNILIAFEEKKAKFTPLKDSFKNLSFESTDFKNNCDEQITWGFLEFSFEPNQDDHLRPALLIDGQHRFYGISDYEDEDLPLLIVSLIHSTPQEQAFQFIVINNKAVRVPTESVKSIIAHLDEKKEEELRHRLLKAGVSYGKQSPILRDINDLSSSPFQNLLNWSYNKQGTKLVSLTAIEQGFRYLKAQFDFLDKDDDDDSLLEIFCAIWRAIKNNYSELWGEDNKFMKKVNMDAMNEFIIGKLKVIWEIGVVDIFDSSSIENQVFNIINSLSPKFWELEWSIKIQDNASVRKMIKEDLQTMTNNHRMRQSWNESLKLPIVTENIFEDFE
ncbi:MAG: DGQHR domain-containing protein [Crocosphaera sp.]|nr:DGQHR domain-containing protein [Crocosphaera sp.]